jgi:CRISPR-associated endonuclease/helicase Cas3
LVETEQILCIVNTRTQARDLSESLHQAGRQVFHLSTWMCPAHRREVLALVRKLLKERDGPPFCLVSTSLIEAGVDIDFPVVYRALAGLDSIIQAAGRGNREARLTIGQVFVFDWPEPPKGDLARRCRAGLEAMQKGGSPLSPEAISFYFNEMGSILGSERLDKKNILQQVAENADEGYFPFQSVAQDFRMIEDNGLPLIIPYNEEAEAALEALRQGVGDRALHHRLQQWIVSVPAYSINKLEKVGAAALVGRDGLYYELINKDLYQRGDPGPALGLDVRNPAFMEAGHLVF